MTFLSKAKDLIGGNRTDGLDEIARLMLAAKEDEKLRRQILFLVQSPATHRKSMVSSALHEMALRGEPEGARAAFALLSTDEGAKAALDILSAK